MRTNNKILINVKIDTLYLTNILDSIKNLTSEICISFTNNVDFLFYDDEKQKIPHKININYKSYYNNLNLDLQRIITNSDILYTKIYELNKVNKYKYTILWVKYKRTSTNNTKESLSIICKNT